MLPVIAGVIAFKSEPALPPPDEFSASDYGTPVFWMEADAQAYTDGQSVHTWVKTQGIYDFTQGDSASQPTFKTNQINGLPVIRFDGTSDYMRPTSVITGPGDNYTFFVVAKASQPQSLIRYQSLFGFVVYPWGGNVAINSVSGSTGSTLPAGIGSSSFTVNSHVYEPDVLSTGRRTYANGVLLGSADTTTGEVSEELWIGAYSGSGISEYFAGDIAEIIIYHETLSDANRQAVEDYLGTKYAITITH